jgi:hypothetical protein
MRLWDIEKEACIRILNGHSDEINNIAYSSQGELLVSGSNDKTLRLWDVTSGQCLDVIQVFQSSVRGVEWIETSDAKYVGASCADGTVGMWKVVVVDGQYELRLHWTTTKGELYVDGAIVQDVQGLSRLNKELLKQRGSVGEPADYFRDATKKLTSIASVVSKLKAPSANDSMEDPEPQVEKANNPEIQEGQEVQETREIQEVQEVQEVKEVQEIQEVQDVSVAVIQTLRDSRGGLRLILGLDLPSVGPQNDTSSSQRLEPEHVLS